MDVILFVAFIVLILLDVLALECGVDGRLTRTAEVDRATWPRF